MRKTRRKRSIRERECGTSKLGKQSDTAVILCCALDARKTAAHRPAASWLFRSPLNLIKHQTHPNPTDLTPTPAAETD
eukprot:2025964-Rhodomonas_salina.1